jgi:hypothetical protein
MFGFLADVRNYSHVPPIANQRGYPKDIDDATLIEIDDNFDHHSRSWLGLDELLAFDYDQTFEDRRCTKEVRAGYFDGAADSGPGKGEVTTFRKFLGTDFFRDLDIMKNLHPDPKCIRIVFSFDN